MTTSFGADIAVNRVGTFCPIYVTLLMIALRNSKLYTSKFAEIVSPVDPLLIVKIHGHHDRLIHVRESLLAILRNKLEVIENVVFS